VIVVSFLGFERLNDSRTVNKGFDDGSRVLGSDRVWEMRIRVWAIVRIMYRA